MSYVLFVVYITNEDVINESKRGSTLNEKIEPVVPSDNRVGNDICHDSDFGCETDAVPETCQPNDHLTEENVSAVNTAPDSPVDIHVAPTVPSEDVNTGSQGDDSSDAGNSENAKELHNADSLPRQCSVKRFLSVHSLKQDVIAKLNQLNVKNTVWQKTYDDSLHQVTFIQESGKRCEQILDALTEVGVGRIAGSSVCVFPSSINIVKDLQTEKHEEQSQVPSLPHDLDALSEEKKSQFKKSIKSRLVVNQVIESVQGNAQFTFDYLMLIILASLIAGMGLAENSSVILVASMLISPLMGPIMAGVFGSVVNDNELRNLGLKSEIIGLCTCVVIGFLLGLITGGVGLKGAIWGSTNTWPTSEMATRGQWRSLWSGILIALPSGAGVALSILGGNAGSLVGVAISASLLPPAVNAGMLWAYAILAGFIPPQFEITDLQFSVQNESQINDTIMNSTAIRMPPNCAKFESNAYVPVHSCNMAIEAAILGAVSLALTILNIFCIVIMGIGMLKIKAVVPSPSTLQEEFFHTDMMIYRQSHSTMKGKKSVEIGKMFFEEYKKLMEEKKDEESAKDTVNKDPESCCPCLKFRRHRQEQTDREPGKNEDKEEDKEDDILYSVKMLFMREALEELEDSYEVKEILRQLPPGRSPVPMSSRLSFVFDEAETKFHELLSTEAEHFDNGYQKTITSDNAPLYLPSMHRSNPYHTIHAFSSQAFTQPVYKFTPRTPQPDNNQKSERFIFPTKPLLRRRTYQTIPRSPGVSLSTIDEGESEVDPPRTFIVKTIKEEGIEPKVTEHEVTDIREGGRRITAVEEIPLLP